MKYGRAYVNGGFRPAIGKVGPKWTRVVYLDGTNVKMTKHKGSLEFQPIKGYNLQALACRMLRRKNSLGIKIHVSKSARKILQEAKSLI